MVSLNSHVAVPIGSMHKGASSRTGWGSGPPMTFGIATLDPPTFGILTWDTLIVDPPMGPPWDPPKISHGLPVRPPFEFREPHRLPAPRYIVPENSINYPRPRIHGTLSTTPPRNRSGKLPQLPSPLEFSATSSTTPPSKSFTRHFTTVLFATL